VLVTSILFFQQNFPSTGLLSVKWTRLFVRACLRRPVTHTHTLIAPVRGLTPVPSKNKRSTHTLLYVYSALSHSLARPPARSRASIDAHLMSGVDMNVCACDVPGASFNPVYIYRLLLYIRSRRIHACVSCLPAF
jgi:hypothetical protein